MAPVFSREAWRCIWHMLQVSFGYPLTPHFKIPCIFSTVNLSDILQFLVFALEWSGPWLGSWLPTQTMCGCEGVTSSHFLLWFKYRYSEILTALPLNFISFWTACTWKDRSYWCTVDCSPRFAFTWKPGKRKIIGYISSPVFLVNNSFPYWWVENLIANYLLIFLFRQGESQNGQAPWVGVCEVLCVSL